MHQYFVHPNRLNLFPHSNDNLSCNVINPTTPAHHAVTRGLPCVMVRESRFLFIQFFANQPKMADRRLATFTRHLLTPLTTSEAAISTVKCCGIIAVVGKTPAVDVLVEGLKILEARGYDSAGISTVSMDKVLSVNFIHYFSNFSPQTLITTKYASAGSTSNAIELLSAKTTVHGKNSIGVSKSYCVYLSHAGIAHTRWFLPSHQRSFLTVLIS